MSLLLLDTQLLIWGAGLTGRLSETARAAITDPASDRAFSVVSVWEVTIKRMLGRPDFRFDPQTLRNGLLARGFREMPLENAHVVAISRLPAIHRDPFDRFLLAQAAVEGATLLTADATLASYPGRIRLVA